MKTPGKALLSVKGLTKDFGGIRAVDSFSFDVHEGSITGIIGPNGAGKTTVFNLVTGIYRPTAGSIFFEGEEMAGLRPDKIVRKGIARTFQNIRLFNRRTCLDNVLTPLLQRERCSFTGALFGTPGARRLERELHGRAIELLSALGLGKYASWQANTLPYGLQRKLERAGNSLPDDFVGAETCHLFSFKKNRAGGRTVDARDKVENGRFPRSVRPNDTCYGSFMHIEGE
jgi:ABC-type branched-subunit amino acid transport system ATPase component